jgi:SAM-dependent methyltransferase
MATDDTAPASDPSLPSLPSLPSPPSDPSPFPPGFFARGDEHTDAAFYAPTRLVTHIDDGAIAAVGALYQELDVTGRVLDLMSSWLSHLPAPPAHLSVLGMNATELAANPMADDWVVHDLNTTPTLPYPDASFDDVLCCVSVDYLTRPVEVFTDVARVLVPGGRFVCTFSNRCFPTKAIRGWLMSDDATHCAIVATYFERAGRFHEPVVDVRVAPGLGRDPLYAVWAVVQ